MGVKSHSSLSQMLRIDGREIVVYIGVFVVWQQYNNDGHMVCWVKRFISPTLPAVIAAVDCYIW